MTISPASLLTKGLNFQAAALIFYFLGPFAALRAIFSPEVTSC